MQIVSSGDNLHEVSDPNFRMSSAEFCPYHGKCSSIVIPVLYGVEHLNTISTEFIDY